MSNPFQTSTPFVEGNPKIRVPQQQAFQALVAFAKSASEEREVGIVLPVGCGKSGCITLAPFAFRSKRTLVVAPTVPIAGQLLKDFDPTNSEMFYQKCAILKGPPFPEPVEIRGTITNISDLEESHVVITNIGQIQGEENRWLKQLRGDFFDLILFDEGHHSIATTWEYLKTHFPSAKIINFSATPLRADGQKMAGTILYSYPIFRAIQQGYVKRLKAVVLNPKTLRYVRREGENEVEVTLDEVRKLGEKDADFRRSIVTSKETLKTIVDASLHQLERVRKNTGDSRHKIIASALNFQHCGQIVEAYRAAGRRADYVHSLEKGAANKKVMERLENNELDVIVQVRKLGEGFDHPYLSVAAVFSIFANLSPFVQFVGRIMRAIKQNAPGDPLNQGVVVFHAGSNIANRWEDFKEYSKADQEFFDQLLPMEDFDFSSDEPIEIEPSEKPRVNPVDIKSQTLVTLEELPLLSDPEVANAIQLLREKGLTPEQYEQAILQPIPTPKVKVRQAARAALDAKVKTEVGRILGSRAVNHQGFDLDKTRRNVTNFVVVKSAIDKRCRAVVGRKSGERSEYTQIELDKININFASCVTAAEQEVFNGKP